MFERMALIGVGLIGSSIAHGARRHGLVKTITATARSEKTRQIVAEQNIADEVYETAALAVAGADLIVICTPVGAFEAVAKDIYFPNPSVALAIIIYEPLIKGQDVVLNRSGNVDFKASADFTEAIFKHPVGGGLPFEIVFQHQCPGCVGKLSDVGTGRTTGCGSGAGRNGQGRSKQI